jgi:hypothetical protein
MPPCRVLLQRQAPNVGRVDGIECWEEADGRTFNVRGRSYMADRVKVPSGHALYRCAACLGVWHSHASHPQGIFSHRSSHLAGDHASTRHMSYWSLQPG